MKQKRFIAVLLCALMVCAMLPLGAIAAEEEEETGAYGWREAFSENPGFAGSPNRVIYREDPAEIPLYRVFGSNRYETALKVAEEARNFFSNHKLWNVIIASGTDFPDALGAAGPAYDLGAPILLVDKNRVTQIAQYVGENIYKPTEPDDGDGCVYIMGGTGAVPANMETELEKAGVDPEKIVRFQGSNRYMTNLDVLSAYGSINAVLVCSGKDFADALSASALGEPILLVADKLTAEQKAVLADLGAKHFYIVGGTAAVSESVENELKTIAQSAGGRVERIYGKNRYETSKAVAEAFWDGCAGVVLSYGLDFPDGLSGATMCFIAECPMLLATTSNISYADECGQNLGVTEVCVLGGPSLISDAAALSVLAEDE